ncbi:aldo/keto reductase [Shewanella glacialimarina]|jgi:predicted oxidoreductase|uniref:aldo/keto reductase n=1 Tax=Shewanella glacialimarina TaxID=2590884 RepID=UPI001CF80C9F|nr:aldo/keto reductase [Shewanella glacialimarina]UCX03491.1 oxidoreductase [Shewanella glacialimarina]
MTTSHFKFSDFIAGFWRIDAWNMTPQQRLTLIEQYLELGVTSMDHADIYGVYQCETLFGEALALAPQLRQKMQLISKCGIKPAFNGFDNRYVNHYDTSTQHIIRSVERSLVELKTDYLDALLIHRPDPLMQADEVAEAFLQLKQQGKVNHFGVSNFLPHHFTLLQSRLDEPLITNQVEISPQCLTHLHDGVLDQCQQLNIRPMAWSCLGGGTLFSEQTEQAIRLRNCLTEVAEQVGVTDISQVIYAWVTMLPSKPTPIIGSSNIERIRSAVDSSSIVLTKQQWFSIWQASTGHSVA